MVSATVVAEAATALMEVPGVEVVILVMVAGMVGVTVGQLVAVLVVRLAMVLGAVWL